ncbi:MAG: hypothetical protein ACREEP_04880 [Dongiaceae bacterium]
MAARSYSQRSMLLPIAISLAISRWRHRLAIISRFDCGMQIVRVLPFVAAVPIYAILALNLLLAAAELRVLVADRASMEQIVGSEAACGMFVQYCSWRVYVAFDVIIFAIAGASILLVVQRNSRLRFWGLSICAAIWIADVVARLWLDDALRSLLRPWFHEV